MGPKKTDEDSFDDPPQLSGQLWKNIALLFGSLWALAITSAGMYLQYSVASHSTEDREVRDRLTILEQRQQMVLRHMDKLDSLDESNALEHERLRDELRRMGK
jgi:hypothetical protein